MFKQQNLDQQKPIRKFFLTVFRKKPLVDEKEIASRLLKTANEIAPPAASVKCVQKVFGSGYKLSVGYGLKYALAGIFIDINERSTGSQLTMRSGRVEGDHFYFSTNTYRIGDVADFERMIADEIGYHNKNLASYPVKCSDLARLNDELGGYLVGKKPSYGNILPIAALSFSLAIGVSGCSSSEKPGTDSQRGDGKTEIGITSTITNGAIKAFEKADSTAR